MIVCTLFQEVKAVCFNSVSLKILDFDSHYNLIAPFFCCFTSCSVQFSAVGSKGAATPPPPR